MMPEILSSKVLVTEETPRTRALAASSAAVTGIVGLAAWGPVNQPVLCTSFDDFKRAFGGYSTGGTLAAPVQAFFANGGARLYVVRSAAYNDVSQPETCKAKPASGAAYVNKDVVATFTARHLGTMGNRLRVDLAEDEAGVHLDVSLDGRRLERWRGLSVADWDQVIERASRFLRVAKVKTAQGEEKHQGSIGRQTVMLVGGDDGPAPQDSDFVGDTAARTGLHALDRVLDLSILLVPNASAEVQRQALLYCQTWRRGATLALLDVPRGLGAEAAAQYVTAERLAESSEHGGIYWPHVLVPNPAPHIFADKTIAVAPSACVAGILGRLAASRPGGIYLPPAGIEAGQLTGAVGLDHDDCLDEAKRDLVYPARINPLHGGPGLPFYIDGSRTLKTAGLCPWVAQRRGLSFIERSLKMRLEYLRHRPLDSALLSEAYREATSFLMAQMRQGAFVSRNPKEAFVVSVSKNVDDPTLQMAVGMAFAKPAEFIWLQVSVDLDGAKGGMP